MSRVLLTWVGLTDLKACESDGGIGLGPIAQAVKAQSFDHIILLCDLTKKEGESYGRWLSSRASATVHLRLAPLSSPTDYEDIYRRVRETIAWARDEFGSEAEFTFHLSPGTPPMAVIWILVGTTERAVLLQSSREQGVQVVNMPFTIAAEFIAQRTGADLERLAAGLRPDDPSFDDLRHQSEQMKAVIDRARLAAVLGTSPILIEGESGTGKELLAAAIHRASGRSGRFIPVNCGAIPQDLVESEFFGHKAGAFTGAGAGRDGHFVEARGGTLFLDEVGELPPGAQVKLLRALQQRKIVRVGESKEIDVDVRIVSATNRDLAREVTGNAFREDLYYRLAVLVLSMPPLRQRQGDILLLADHCMQRLQDELSKAVGRKTLSAGAKKVLLEHDWPGNVRELEATLLRAIAWSRSTIISDVEMRDAITTKISRSGSVLDHTVGNGFDLRKLLNEISTHYLRAAIAASPHNKTEAAKLLGFGSQQLLTQWMKRLKVDGAA